MCKKTVFFLILMFASFFLFAQESEQPVVIRTDPFSFDEWLYLYQEGLIEDDDIARIENDLEEEDYIEDEIYLADEIEIDDKTIITDEEIAHIDIDKNLQTAGNENSQGADEITEETYQHTEEEILLAEDDILSEEDGVLLSSVHQENNLENIDEFDDDDLFFFEGPDFVFEVPEFETRSFEDIFPDLSVRQRRTATTANGLRTFLSKDDTPMLNPNPELGIDLLSGVMDKKPSHIIEMVKLVPYNERELDLIDIYNAVGRIGNIKDYPVPVRGEDFYIFTESTRLESSRQRRAIPDPSPADSLPFSETLYLRIKEASVGNLFIRGDISFSVYGLTYNMTNFLDVWYFVVPIMKAERFSIVIYLEPVKEGVLIYCVTGFYIPGIVADRVNLTPSINRRIQILFNWITDGLKIQEQTRVIENPQAPPPAENQSFIVPIKDPA